MSIAVTFYLRNEEEKLIFSVSFSVINLGLCDIFPNVLYSPFGIFSAVVLFLLQLFV